jgi:outer membrane protein
MKKILIAAAVGMLVAGQVAAQESPWLVRARAVHLESVNDTTGTVHDLGVNVNNKWLPEVDISYFLNKNVAAELILTVPQEHTVSDTSGALGTFKHLPPTLTLQYHFTDLGAYKPYVGAGLNYTKISSVSLNKTGVGALTLDNSSFGAALQAGVDIPLDKQWSLNVDVKKVYIKTDVYTAAGANLGTLKLNPVLFGAGVGYRF